MKVNIVHVTMILLFDSNQLGSTENTSHILDCKCSCTAVPYSSLLFGACANGHEQ